jgi:hypothetical protein
MTDVCIDWAQDGFDDGSSSAEPRLVRMLPQPTSVSDEVTDDVMSFICNRGASSDHVSGPAPGSCTLILRNDDGRYTPDNTASPLYGLLKPGRPVWIGRNADGTMSGTGQTVYGVWAGYIREIAPMAAAGKSPTVEVICEDPLGYYSRQPTSVTASTTRSVEELRGAVLDDIGESADRRDLAREPNTMQLSWADAESALDVLNEINTATGTRHSIEPGDSKEEFYFYTTVGRDYKLDAATDFALNGDNIQVTAGYRVTEQNIVNYQVVSFEPSSSQTGRETVWTYDSLPKPIAARDRVRIRAEFDDFVHDAALVMASENSLAFGSLVSYGNVADVGITATAGGIGGIVDTVTALSITGRPVVRLDALRLIGDDTTSEDNYGRRAGGSISGPYVGAAPLGQGLADFIVWKFAEPLKRPAVTVTNLLATVNGRTLYDTVALTIDALSVSSRRLELVGEEVACDLAAKDASDNPVVNWATKWELQETRNQTPLDLFILDTSTLGGADLLGY